MNIENRTIGGILKSMGQMLRPPKRITVVEAAEKYYHLNDGGRYDITTTPYMATPMNAITRRDVTTVVFVGSARSGKTLGLIGGGMAYIITSNPSDTLIVHMTEGAARKYSKLTVARMIKNSPVIGRLLSPSKDDNNILAKFFRNGMALIIAHPSPTQLSAADYKFVFLSDFDRMPEDNGEGSVFIQASKRTQTFMSAGCTVVESSPGRDFMDTEWEKSSPHEAPPVGGILGLYNDGDRHIQYWECPHCAEEIGLYPGLELFCLPPVEELLLEIEEFGAVTTSIKYAKIYCTECGAQIDQSQKSKMNEKEIWHPETDKVSKIMSFWGSGYAAAFQSWDSLLEREFTALQHYSLTGDESKLKATRNVDQSIPFMSMAVESKLTAKALEARAEALLAHHVPPQARFLVASVDVQKWKFVVQVEAYGVDYESWLVDRFDIAISERPQVEGSDTMSLLQPASYTEDWALLIDRVINARYPLEGDEQGRDMGVIMTVCDSGGAEGTTENAYRFWKLAKKLGLQRRFNLIKGLRPARTANTPLVTKTILDKSSKSARNAKVVGQQPLWMINTTQYKDTVIANLGRKDFGAGYIHFPNHLSMAFYSEVVAETRTDKGWDNMSNKRNEAFDLFTYSRAAVKIKLLEHWQSEINWDKPPPWADIWDRNSEVSNPDDRDDNAPKVPTKVERKVRMRSKLSRR